MAAQGSALVYLIRGRFMGTVAKGANRAAVHGSNPPVTTRTDRKEAEAAIEQGKEEKQKKIEEVEKKVNGKAK